MIMMYIIDMLSPLLIIAIIIGLLWYCLVTIGPWFLMSILIGGYLIFCLLIEYTFFDE